jgi:ribosomal protein S18 acetylase RimI-like enzyme
MLNNIKLLQLFERSYHSLNLFRSRKALLKNLSIRLITEIDLSYLDLHFESEYLRSHADDLEAQNLKKISFFLAWIGNHAVGHMLVYWPGPRATAVKKQYPVCPEIYRLEVLRPYRSIGIGSLLIDAGCEEAKEREFEEIGLGVDTTNPRANSLYLRLNFHQSSISHYLDEYKYINQVGEVVSVSESGTWLVKTL